MDILYQISLPSAVWSLGLGTESEVSQLKSWNHLELNVLPHLYNPFPIPSGLSLLNEYPTVVMRAHFTAGRHHNSSTFLTSHGLSVLTYKIKMPSSPRCTKPTWDMISKIHTKCLALCFTIGKHSKNDLLTIILTWIGGKRRWTGNDLGRIDRGVLCTCSKVATE